MILPTYRHDLCLSTFSANKAVTMDDPAKLINAYHHQLFTTLEEFLVAATGKTATRFATVDQFPHKVRSSADSRRVQDGCFGLHDWFQVGKDLIVAVVLFLVEYVATYSINATPRYAECAGPVVCGEATASPSLPGRRRG